jgi:hypothetical protein
LTPKPTIGIEENMYALFVDVVHYRRGKNVALSQKKPKRILNHILINRSPISDLYVMK